MASTAHPDHRRISITGVLIRAARAVELSDLSALARHAHGQWRDVEQ
jgi:hypothetical protein